MDEKGFDYRSFYTWDHSTNWDLGQPGARLGGCNDPYGKPRDAFLEDYRRLIDFMATVGLNHLIIWGALRDAHGGSDMLRQVVQHGRANGVRVAPGVGVNAYGGIYYEGEHEFSLARLLTDRPDLAAVGADGQPLIAPDSPLHSAACPRNEEVRDWHIRAVDWLMAEVAPDAIHFEGGDYGVCHCQRCVSARSSADHVSYDDLAEALPPLVAEVRRFNEDCWLSYNHYTGYTRDMTVSKPRFAEAIPQDVICKWGVSWMLEPAYADEAWRGEGMTESITPGIRPPTETSMAHLHFGTGWWNCSPRGTLEIGRFLRYIPMVREVGFQGVCTHGEESSLNPPAELNYYVFAALAQNPNASVEQIAQGSVGELLGGDDMATRVLAAFRDDRVPPELLPRVAAAADRASGQMKVRLNWLTFELQRLAERTREPHWRVSY